MLKLNKLTLKGFGIFKEEKVFEYENNFNILHCENGKGKTTSFNAIEMLLISNYDGSYSDYLNTESEEFKISLDFNLNKYHLYEELTYNGTTSTRVLKNADTDEDLASGEKVKIWLNKYLPTSITKYALFARQNSKIDIINCSDSERRDIFKKIQDLDYSKEIETIIVPKINSVKESITNVDKEIFALENKKYQKEDLLEYPFTEEEYENKKLKVESINSKKSLFEEKLKQKENMISRANSIEEEINELKENKEESLSKIDDCNTKIEKIKSDLENEKISKESSISEKERAISSLTLEKENLRVKKEEEKNNLEKVVKTNTSELADIDSKLENIKLKKIVKFNDNLLDDAIFKVSEKKTEITLKEKDMESLKDGICPICGSNCTHKLSEYTDDVNKLKLELVSLNNNVSSLKAKKLEVENDIKKNDDLKTLKMNLSSTRDKIVFNIENANIKLENLDVNYEKQYELIDEKITNNEKSIEDIKTQSDSFVQSSEEMKNHLDSMITSLESSIKDTEKKITKKEDEISKLKDEIDSINEDSFNDEELNKLNEEISSYEDVVNKNKFIKENNSKLDVEKENDSKKLEEFKDERKKYENQLFNLESAKSIMTKDYPNWVIENSIQNMENSMNEFINDVYYKPLYISLRSTKTSIKLEYGKNENHKLPCSRLSGAEKQIVNLAFINNFNKMLGLNVIFLDEIDAPLDNDRKEILYESLLNLSNVYEQIVVVTHSDKMNNYIKANTECNSLIL